MMASSTNMGKLDTHKKTETKCTALTLQKVSSEWIQDRSANPETTQVNCFKMSRWNMIPEKDSTSTENKNWQMGCSRLKACLPHPRGAKSTEWRVCLQSWRSCTSSTPKMRLIAIIDDELLSKIPKPANHQVKNWASETNWTSSRKEMQAAKKKFGKVFRVLGHHWNASQSDPEILFHPSQNGCHLKK